MFKYFKLLALMKNVADAYQEEHEGAEKPWYLTRRFVGVVVALAGYLVYLATNNVIPPEMLNALTDNIMIVKQIVQDAIPIIMTLYGAIMAIVGIITKKQPVEPPAPEPPVE